VSGLQTVGDGQGPAARVGAEGLSVGQQAVRRLRDLYCAPQRPTECGTRSLCAMGRRRRPGPIEFRDPAQEEDWLRTILDGTTRVIPTDEIEPASKGRWVARWFARESKGVGHRTGFTPNAAGMLDQSSSPSSGGPPVSPRSGRTHRRLRPRSWPSGDYTQTRVDAIRNATEPRRPTPLVEVV